MSSPPRGARRSSSIHRDGFSASRRMSGTAGGSGIPVPNSSLRTSRLNSTQPTYDFIAGGSTTAPTPVKRPPSRQQLRQSVSGNVKPDIGNEELRAQIKTLQYEVDSLKHDREVADLRHEKELREAQVKAEEVFHKARAEDGRRTVPAHKYEALGKELKDAQDEAINQKTVLEKRLRTAQDDCRSAREEASEAQNDLASMDRQHQHELKEIDSKHTTLRTTMDDLRTELSTASNALKATQDRLSQREADAGDLESEVLRLKAQSGDADTLTVIKRELSEQVAHIRKLESTNREQSAELKHFRKVHKASEVVEEEKRVLESKLGLLEGTQKQLREAQLQRQILEDERNSWTSYLQSQSNDDTAKGDKMEFESPEDVARAFVRQKVENASLVQQMGAQRSEILERDEIIRQMEGEKTTLQTEVDKIRASSKGATGSNVFSSNTTNAGLESRSKQRLESQLNFAKKEVSLMREQLRSFDAEEQTYTENKFDAAKSQRISDLESLLDEHRRELADLTSELSAVESKTSSSNTNPLASISGNSISPLKRPRSPSPGGLTANENGDESPSANEQGRESELVGRLTRKNRTMQSELASLSSRHSVLQSETSALQAQLASLRDGNRTRVLTLRNNPTDEYERVKLSTIRALRAENKDLLSALQNRALSSSEGSSASASAGKSAARGEIPASTLETLRHQMKEKDGELAEREKRMLRLKQIWGQKALEMREAILSLLGWAVEFRSDGKFALSLLPLPQSDTTANTNNGGRKTRSATVSQRTEGGGTGGNVEDNQGEEEGGTEGIEREEETLIFDGERGTMKVSGGTGSRFARQVRPFYREWVEARGNVPGFMGAVVVARAAGEM